MEHFIKNIEITNFKSIRHAEVKDCRRVNVFVGPPNVGKSNILEALSLFSVPDNVRSGLKLTSLVRLTETSDIFFDGLLNEGVSIRINGDFEVQAKYISPLLKLSFQLLDWKSIKNHVKTNHSIESIPFTFNWVRYDDLEYHSIDGSFLQTHLRIQFPIPKKYKFYGTTFQAQQDLQTLSYPFGTNLKDVVKNNIYLRKDFTEILKTNGLDLLFSSKSQSLSLYKKTDTGVFEISWELIADTLQHLFFYKAAISSNQGTVLLFEEPEANCYEPYILEFTNSVKRDQNNNQFFIVTHSQYVIEELLRDEESRDDTNIYLVGLENNETKVKLLSPEMNKEIYQTGLNVFFNYQSLWNEMSEHEAVH